MILYTNICIGLFGILLGGLIPYVAEYADLISATNAYFPFDPALPNVTIFATGGTFAGDGPASKTTGYKAGVLDVANIIAGIPGIFNVANIRLVQYANQDSIDATPKQDYELSHLFQDELDSPTTQGVVWVTGTDTMEESAFFMALTVMSDKALVITGSARPPTAAIYDGKANLLNAIVLAVNQEAKNRGVMITFFDRILSPHFATKVNSNQLDLFQAGDAGNLGTFINVQPIFYYPASRPLGHVYINITQISPDTKWPRISMEYGHQDPATAVNIEPETDGLILPGLGAGYWPSKGVENMRRILNGTNIPVVMCSRTLWGFVQAHNIDFGIGAELLSPPKALTLLRLGIRKGLSLDAIKRLFTRYDIH